MLMFVCTTGDIEVAFTVGKKCGCSLVQQMSFIVENVEKKFKAYPFPAFGISIEIAGALGILLTAVDQAMRSPFDLPQTATKPIRQVSEYRTTVIKQ